MPRCLSSVVRTIEQYVYIQINTECTSVPVKYDPAYRKRRTFRLLV